VTRSGRPGPLAASRISAADVRAPFVLASASPRRLALLRQAGLEPSVVIAPEIDETPRKGELPRSYALRVAVGKTEAVVAKEAGSFVLAADTVVAAGRRILPKAEGADEVGRCLRLLSGRRHMVLTALALKPPGKPMRTRVVATRVAFKVLTAREIEAYVASGEGEGKAGGYAVQGRAEAFVRSINGSYSNVVGLPLYETLGLLEGSGWSSEPPSFRGHQES
jgi:septum formation protein